MITILSGTNNYLLRAKLRTLIGAFKAVHDDMSLEQLAADEASFERIQEALQSLPFLSDKKMVVLHEPSANKLFVEKATVLLQDLPESTELIVVEPKLDKRSVYYKMLKKHHGYQEFSELDEPALAKWLVQSAQEKQANLSPVDARYLIERVGPNQQFLGNEIEKLSLYVHSNKGDARATINRTIINNLTASAPQSTIFQLLEAAFAGNQKQALALYREQRALKVEPQQLIAMLSWQLHIVALVKAAGSGKTTDEIARDAKISPYVVRKTAGIARGVSVAKTRQLVADLLTIDERLKRQSLDADDVLLGYIMNLVQ